MKIKPIALLTLFLCNNVNADELAANYSFDPSFLKFGNKGRSEDADLSYFSTPDGVLPGEYIVGVYVNKKPLGQEKIIFKSGVKRPPLPEILLSSLKQWGVNTAAFSNEKKAYTTDELESMIQGFWYKFNKNNQTIEFNIPQVWLYQPEWSQTPPQSWDDGEFALLSNYRVYNVQRKYNSTSKTTNSFSSNSGLNIAGWRLRHNGYWISEKKGWNSLNTFARHDYSFWQGGQLTIGQTSTDDRIFESFPFEGISISSDDGMIVPSLTNYSPVVRGIAYSPAEVIIRQNNTIIWQGEIPAGAFELQDVYPLFSGDMDVEIRESSGEVRHFTQASSTLPILQQKGRLRYHVAVGRYRVAGKHGSDQPAFLQASAAWGIGWDTTLYSGIIASEGYQSEMLGIGKYMARLGAFSLDLSHSKSDSIWDKSKQDDGYAARLMYSRGIESIGSQFNLTGYWYGSSSYNSFNEYQQQKIYDETPNLYKPKAKIYTQWIQQLGRFGQVNLTAQLDEYKNLKRGEQYRASLSMPLETVSTSIAFNYNKQPQLKDIDKSILASISVPFSAFSNYSAASLSTQLYNTGNSTSTQAGINGTLFDQKLYYSFMEGLSQGDERIQSGTAYVNYKTSKGEVQTTVSHQKNGKQVQFGAAGGVVLHKQGVTLTQPLSLDSANALIDTNGIDKIKVKRGSNIYTDSNGFAVVPNLAPYQRNSITLDVTKVNDTTEIIKSDAMVIPSRGALVKAKFDVVSGRKALIKLVRENGESVPFGSIVSISNGSVDKSSNFVSDNGQVWMSGLPNEGVLNVQWGDDNKRNCIAPFKFSKNIIDDFRLTLVCK